MVSSASLLIIIVSFLWSTSALHERYVKPDNPSSLICPGQPCLTLDQYASNTTYFTTGSTFLFLSGNHCLQTTINLTDIYNLKFKRNEEQDSTIHGNGSKILCKGVINMTIDGLTLKATNLEVFKSKGIMIFNSTFLGNGTLSEYSTGALTSNDSNITVIHCHFEENTGNSGGAISIEFTNLDLISSTFFRNMAYDLGGAIYAVSSNLTVRGTLMYGFTDNGRVIFSGNTAGNGGAIYLERTIAVFSGVLIFFKDNSALKWVGGGIRSRKSSLTFQSSTTLFSGNFANLSGGAIDTTYGTIRLLSGNTSFTNNSANFFGGALYGSSIDMDYYGNIIFSHNSAKRGGGMYFIDVSLKIITGMKLNASFNEASEYGGAIYHEDILTPYQCAANLEYEDNFPYCFIELIGTELTGDTSIAIHSYYNTAGKDGSFIYGGSLDRCQIKSTSVSGVVKYTTDYPNLLKLIQYQQNNNLMPVTSQPYQLCSCGSDSYDLEEITVETHRGQKFTLPLYAVAQGEVNVSTTVTAKLKNTSRLEAHQIHQKLPTKECFNISYNLYSTEDYEELTLHPDGTCSDYGKIIVIM